MKIYSHCRCIGLAVSAWLALAAAPASAASCGAGFSYANNFSPILGLSIDWGACGADNNSLQMKVTANTTGWVAVGFAPADAVEGEMMLSGIDTFQTGVGAGGVAYGRDGFANQYSAPATDAQQNYTIVAGTEVGGQTTIEFFRLLNTGDTVGDHDLSVGLYYLTWSFRGGNVAQPDNMNLQHGPSGNSAQAIQFQVPVAPVPVPAAAWLFVSALGGLGLSNKRFRRKRTIR